MRVVLLQLYLNKIIEYDLSHTYSDVFVMTHTTNPLLSKETVENKSYIKTKKDKSGHFF